MKKYWGDEGTILYIAFRDEYPVEIIAKLMHRGGKQRASNGEKQVWVDSIAKSIYGFV